MITVIEMVMVIRIKNEIALNARESTREMYPEKVQVAHSGILQLIQ